jgi:hypothetical protein
MFILYFYNDLTRYHTVSVHGQYYKYDNNRSYTHQMYNELVLEYYDA